jgi:hypothetical protein
VASTDCAVWMVQLETARQLHWQRSYAGVIEANEEWAPPLQEHAASILDVATSAMRASYSADTELCAQQGFHGPGRLRFLRDLLEENIADGLQPTIKEVVGAEDAITFLGRVGSGIASIELDDILHHNGKGGEKDPKKACIEELAEWMVAQSQQHLEAEIYSRGRLAELPSSSFYAVLWAIREASQTLFYGDKCTLSPPPSLYTTSFELLPTATHYAVG